MIEEEKKGKKPKKKRKSFREEKKSLTCQSNFNQNPVVDGRGRKKRLLSPHPEFVIISDLVILLSYPIFQRCVSIMVQDF